MLASGPSELPVATGHASQKNTAGTYCSPAVDVLISHLRFGYSQVKPNGDIVLNTNGYLTHTTQLSMNDALELVNCKVQGTGCRCC
jgi:hypothetical protein